MSLYVNLAKKTIYRFFVFLIVISLVFLIPRLAPGTPIDYLVEDPRVPPEIRVELIKKFGLDKPIFPDQYIQFLVNFFTKLDLGFSFTYQEPVMKVILERLVWSVVLMGGALLVSIPAGVSIGLLLAWKRGSHDYIATLVLLFLRSFPTFWFGMILILVLSYHYKLFPSGGATTPGAIYSNIFDMFRDVLYHITLPIITLSTVYIPRYALITRANALNVVNEDFVLVGVAKGLSSRQILLSYILRNTLLPVMTVASIDIGFIVGGAIVTETVFSYPGMGTLIYTAVFNRDYPLLLGVFTIVSALTLALITVVEYLYTFIDPRVRVREV